MAMCKVKSGILDNATLYCKTPETPENDQGWVGFANQSIKKHLFFFKISKDNNIHVPEQEEPYILEINQSYLDTLDTGDIVEIFPYNIPKAKEIDLIFNSEQHPLILQGNWTSVLKKELNGVIFDSGMPFNLTTTITHSGRSIPTRVQGLAAVSSPMFPVEIGEFTTIRLRKMLATEYAKSRNYLSSMKSNRIKEFQQQLKHQFSNIIDTLKLKIDTKSSESLYFYEVNGEEFDDALKGVFSSYESHNISKKKAENSFVSSKSFIIRKNLKPIYLIEYILTSASLKNKGSVNIISYSDNLESSEKMTSGILESINKLYRGLKGSSKSISRTCPHCGAQIKENQEMTDNCIYCKRPLSV
ncbi:MAG: hypothetical protein ACTSRK_01320 [Promethearchaeota archaeon]